jgi:Lrp/AsnC family transcriptional regulator for asnA, asnC and gidA
VGAAVAALPTTRWCAATGEGITVQSAVAGLPDLAGLLAQLGALDGVRRVSPSLYAEIYKRSSTVYAGGELPPVAQD